MRRVDPSITKRAQKMISRVKKAAQTEKVELTDWEGEFLESLEERLEKYGSAFADPDLGAICGALSLRQGLKLKQIKQKAMPKAIKPKNPAIKSASPASKKVKQSPIKDKLPKPMKRSSFKRKIPNFAHKSESEE